MRTQSLRAWLVRAETVDDVCDFVNALARLAHEAASRRGPRIRNTSGPAVAAALCPESRSFMRTRACAPPTGSTLCDHVVA